MKKNLYIMFLIISALFIEPAFANNLLKAPVDKDKLPLFESGIIRGTVIDSNAHQPLAFASVILYKEKDSTFITGASTGTNGEFIFHNVTEGEYFIKVKSLGYSNKLVSNIKVYREKAEYNAGTLPLTKTVLQTSQVEVTGERPNEELHLDKKVINVSKNLNASGGTALDVLQDQPSVRVDQDGTVYLRGSSNFTVLINGKPSVLQGADALKQISANMIETIELMTNPSAKYDAEGAAGIINIVLKKQTDYSLSGILNLNSGTRDKYNSDFTVNYNVDGFNFTGGVDYRDNRNYHDQDIRRNSDLTSGTVYNSTYLAIGSHQKQYSIRGGLDYTINESHSLSLNLSGGRMDLNNYLNSTILNEAPAVTDYAMNEGHISIDPKYFNSTFNYNYKIVPASDELALELTYSRITLPSGQTTNEYVTDAAYNKASNPAITWFTNDGTRNEGRAKLDFSHKFTAERTLEAGLQSNFSFRNFDIVNKLYDWTINDYVIDNSLTNNFKYHNNIYAGFVSYSDKIEEFNFQAGLRGEYVDRLLDQSTIGSSYNYYKMDYFPSLSISRKIDDHQLQFSYSRRVNRPNENLLNPYPFYQDKYLESRGNPYLLQEYINSLELNYQKMFGSIFFSAQTYFRNSTNATQQTFTIDNTGRMISTFNNFGKTNTYGAELSSSFAAAGIFRFDPAVELYGTQLKGSLAGLNIDKSFFNWNGRLNTTVTFTPDTRLMITGLYVAKYIDAQMNIKPFFQLSASLKQDFFEKRLSLTLQGRNLLKLGNVDVRTYGTNYTGDIKVLQEVPVVTLMLSYNFNNFKKVQKPTTNIDIPTGL
jgi:outer membrane receptor protein involved in Fe transport